MEKCVPNCTSPTTYTTYVFSGSKVVAEYDNGAAPSAPSREYVYGGSALLAKIDSSGTKYYHQDQLSNRLVTSSTGAVLAQMGHFPFGESWYNATNDKLFFTTYERDAESGNDYAQARYYVNRLALFSALDSISGDNSDPQSLNLYPYVRNDPIDFLDPTGQFRAAVCVIPAYANCGLGGGGGNDSWEGELIDFAFTPTFWGENGPVLGNLGALDLLDPGSPIGSGVGGGLQKINEIVNAALKQPKLGKCLNEIFGPGMILTNSNLPKLNTTVSEAELSRRTGVPTVSTIQTPVPSTGPGTVLIATETFYGPDSSAVYLQSSYLHETGNILATQLFGDWNARPDSDPIIKAWDHDTGANLEDCIFGGIVLPDGSVTRNPQ